MGLPSPAASPRFTSAPTGALLAAALTLLPIGADRTAAQDTAPGWVTAQGPGLTAVSGPAAVSGSAAPRVLQAVPVEEGAVRLDGRFTEAVWLDAPPATGFTQRSPDDGAAATERTEVRVAYSSAAIYVAVRAFDSEPEGIRARLARRDALGDSDQVAVLFDSYHDRRTSFEFAVTPRGSIGDVYRGQDRFGGGDDSWDPVWEVATSMDEEGWSAEFRIPFSQLRYDAGSTTWGFQVFRRIERKAEEVWWAPYSREESGFASRFGRLEGLEDLPAPLRLEARPYVVTDVRARPDGLRQPHHGAREPGMNAGLDLKYGITSDFTLDLTANPDFGQVEADPAVVNLSAFESFFPEKRPFFVEGGALFQQWSPAGQLFYSRRIGRPPQGSAPPPAGGYVERPEATAILSAAKVTGKTGGGLGLGVMSALTRREFGTLRDEGGRVVGEHPLEPATHYFMGRGEQDFRDGSHTVGVVATAVNRRLGDDFVLLRSAAYVAGADGVHRWRENRYRLEWQVVGSHIGGSPDAITAAQRHPFRYFQRPDAEHLELDPARTSLSGYSLRLQTSKDAGSWRYQGEYARISPGFDSNDMGFQWGADQQRLGLTGRYVRSRPMGIFRNFQVRTDFAQQGTTGGEGLMTWFRPVVFDATFRNNWTLAATPVAFFADELNVHALRGGPGLRENTWTNSWVNLGTDARKPVSLRVWANAGAVLQRPGQDRFRSMSPTLTLRPSDVLRASVGVSYNERRTPKQWVGRGVVEDSTRYVVASLDHRTLSVTTRLDWTLSPTLSVQLYGQPFTSAGRYDTYKEVVDPGSRRFDERFRVFGDELACGERSCRADLSGDGTPDLSFGRPDFTVKQLRTTAILRWEYRPGSVLFVAWQHGRSDFLPDGTYRGFRALDDLFSLESDNTLLVKLNYWLSL